MYKVSANKVYTMTGPPQDNVVMVLEDDGHIAALIPRSEVSDNDVDILEGILVPGFINTHCHLELSHMLGAMPTGTGLIDFIRGVITKRGMPAEVVQDAIARAEQEMIDAGIVAVGDISNTTDTLRQKSGGRLNYYTFVEMFDFLQVQEAQEHFDRYRAVLSAFRSENGIRGASHASPHSPYTVSEELFARIDDVNPGSDITVSIHNQEMAPENQLFLEKSGDLLEFYADFGISLDEFVPTGRTSIWYLLKNLNPAQRNLFVHNTLTTEAEIQAAQAWSDHVYWATCANANLYIENRLPDYSAFIATDARLTIGTDSLTSNWQLSVLEEMKTIKRYASYLSTDQLIEWGTLNGARALGFEAALGTLEVGKKPGLNLIQGLDEHDELTSSSTVRRLF